MNKLIRSLTLVATFLAAGSLSAKEGDLLPGLQPLVGQITQEFDQIPAERQLVLKKAALFIRSKIQAKEAPQLNFICTHNSRRSHLSQIWAQTAAAYYDLAGVKTFSGGTEATACNPRTVAALTRAGFDITNSTPDAKNPVYLVKYSGQAEPVKAYSKVYSADGNPKENFVAFMTCDHADVNCPVVQGSLLRVPVHYKDPKVSDGTPAEAATYDERCRQIAREMFYMMSQVNA